MLIFINFFYSFDTAVPPVVPELFSDDDATHFDDIPDPDSGEEFFPTPKVDTPLTSCWASTEMFFFVGWRWQSLRFRAYSRVGVC